MEQMKETECKHVPVAKTGYVGMETKCALCGVGLIYGNHPAGSKVRMSKKERRAMKRGAAAIDKMVAKQGEL